MMTQFTPRTEAKDLLQKSEFVIDENKTGVFKLSLQNATLNLPACVCMCGERGGGEEGRKREGLQEESGYELEFGFSQHLDISSSARSSFGVVGK